MTAKTIVIIGAGSFGTILAKRLYQQSSNDKIILINKFEFVFFLPSSPRLIIDENIENVSLSLGKHLKKEISSGRLNLIIDEVCSIDAKSVHLKKSESIIFDILVICTGATWPDPIDSSKFQGPTTDSITTYIKPLREKYKKADSIAFVGGGDVTLELIGELATESPDKRYYIIHSHQQLLTNQYIPKVRDQCKAQLDNQFPGAITYYFN